VAAPAADDLGPLIPLGLTDTGNAIAFLVRSLDGAEGRLDSRQQGVDADIPGSIQHAWSILLPKSLQARNRATKQIAMSRLKEILRINL
jgi:hypothetical protein